MPAMNSSNKDISMPEKGGGGKGHAKSDDSSISKTKESESEILLGTRKLEGDNEGMEYRNDILTHSDFEHLNETDVSRDVTSEGEENMEEASFINLVRFNRAFRYYLSSYLITCAGEWLTYVASIELLEQLLGQEKSESRRYVSLLVVCRLIPNFILIPFGGILADIRDKRQSMMALDLVGAIVPLLFLAASYFKSIQLIYFVTLAQASIASLYEPCRSSILPLMVKEDENLRLATTLTGMAWSVMASIGSGLGGYFVAEYGMTACFVLDSASYAMSAWLLYRIGGEWQALSDGERNNHGNESIRKQIENMIVMGWKYVVTSSFWPLVFMKSTTSLVYGGSDILNVSFAEEDPFSTKEEQSKKLGTLFLCVGLGCFIGPILFEPFTRIDKPKTVLDACVFSFLFQAVGCLVMGYFRPFSMTMLSTIVRSAGSSILWIDSQVLLQLAVKSDMLGRVVAIDYGFALAAEACSAMVAGLLQDNYNVKPREVSSIMGMEALFFFTLWWCYSTFGSDDVFQTIKENSESEQSTTKLDKRREEMRATERTKLLPHCV